MKRKDSSRREFIKKTAMTTTLLSIGGMGMSAKSYGRIKGANDRINLALIGLGRRYGGYIPSIEKKGNNVNLLYLCDVLKSQREKAGEHVKDRLGYLPKLENSYFNVIEDPEVDAVFLATPDHWHAAGTWLAVGAGKHVYVEKPCSHNPREGEIMTGLVKKYGKIIQMGNQQRSSLESIQIIKEIHEGIIGTPYLAHAFYNNARGRVVNPVKESVPEGLDWELWQGPAPRKPYEHNTWDYNWHWYGWDYGTGETGNNATHELDIGRWALQVDYPEKVIVDAGKQHWKDDGWTMYDTMDAAFKFEGDKTIKWDGKSRNNYKTYGSGRGTIIYGTEGSVYVDREGYRLYDRSGTETRSSISKDNEDGTQLGGGGGITTRHCENFYQAIRGMEKQRSPIDEGHKSTLMCHLANMAYRTGEVLECNPKNGHILNSKTAQKLWARKYEKGWEPDI